MKHKINKIIYSKKKSIFLSLVIFSALFLFSGEARGATHKLYVDDDNVCNGDASGETCVDTIAEVQNWLDNLQVTDPNGTYYIYFERGDSWLIDGSTTSSWSGRATSWTSKRDGAIFHDHGTLVIDAYGSGALPVLDGGQMWPSNPYDGGGRNDTDAIIAAYGKGDLTVRNIRLSNFFGTGIKMTGTISNVLVEDCESYYMGGSFFADDSSGSYKQHITVQNNTIEYSQQTNIMYLLGYLTVNPYWGGAISMQGGAESGPFCPNYDVLIKNNRINYSGGEGIIMGGHYHASYENIVEYNIVSNTGHIAIHIPSHANNGGKVTVRHNLVYWLQGLPDYYKSTGIYVYDECESVACKQYEIDNGIGDNSTAERYIYGNTIINARTGSYSAGIWIFPSEDQWGKIWIWNNTFIDCEFTVRLNTDLIGNAVVDGRFINNASINYTETGAPISYQSVNDHFSNWTMTKNLWYGDAVPAEAPWTTGMLTGNPKLSKTSGWQALSAMPTFNDLYFSASDSALIDAGAALSSSYDNQFLIDGTDFGTGTFRRSAQEDNGTGWEVGALIYTNGTISAPSAPAGLTVR